MPPRKKLAVTAAQPPVSAAAPSNDDESVCTLCSRDECDRDDVHAHAVVFNSLPTDALLSLSVGICARLQLAFAQLKHKPAMIGHGPGGLKRVIRDEMRVVSSARRMLSAALNELLAIEAVLVHSHRDAEEELSAADE
jgi:hypothetical protein